MNIIILPPKTPISSYISWGTAVGDGAPGTSKEPWADAKGGIITIYEYTLKSNGDRGLNRH